MPQLNPEFFISQLFWLTICFCFLLLFLWKISLPRISGVLEKREGKINSDIDDAKKLQIDAEEIQKKIDKKIFESQLKSKEKLKESINFFQEKADKELKKVDLELEKKINESASVIEKNKIESLKTIDSQIVDIAKLTLSKISSLSYNEDEIKNSVNEVKNRGIN